MGYNSVDDIIDLSSFI